MSQIERLLSEARMTAEESTQDESDFTEVRNKRKRFRKVPTPINNVRPMIVSIDPRPSQFQFAKAIRSKFPAVKIKQIRELRNNTDFFIQPEDLTSRECLMLSLNLNQAFPNAKMNARNTLPKPKTKPSFVIVNVHHSITEDEVKEELLNNNAMNVTKVSRITSRATGQPTKLIRVITESNNQVNAAQKHGVKIGWQLYRCEASREPPHVMQCFKCQKFGRSARDCTNAIRCLRCSQDHSVKECNVAKENANCSNCGGAHATVYRGCPAYQHKLAEASKKINENKFSAVTNKQSSQAKTDLTPSTEKIAVLVAEVLSKIRTVLNTMSYSDIINIVSNSASRIFNEKIDGQRIHDSIKSANTTPVVSIQTNNLPNSENFSQNG